MRLPWLQIDADGMTRGEMLGRLLGIGPHAGVGVALSVWRWALEMAPEGDFSGGPHDAVALAAGVGCDNPRLVDELPRCGLVVVVADAGLMPVSFKTVRVRGLDRYRRAWEKNKRRKPALVVPVTGAGSAGTGAEPARPAPLDGDGDGDDVVAQQQAPPKPRKVRKPSAAEEFFGWLNATRATIKSLEPQPVPSRARLNKTFGDALVTCGRATLEGKYRAYLADPTNAAKDPPWPWEIFGTTWSWRKATAVTTTAAKFLDGEARKNLYADGAT